MSNETLIAAMLRADTTVTSILTGGIYSYSDLTPEGITRTMTPVAYDADGFLLPIALIKERGVVPDGNLVDYDTLEISSVQVVECWLYQRISYDAIDAVKPRIFRALQGSMHPNGFEIALVNTLSRQRDNGTLQDASLERMDFACVMVGNPLLVGSGDLDFSEPDNAIWLAAI